MSLSLPFFTFKQIKTNHFKHSSNTLRKFLRVIQLEENFHLSDTDDIKPRPIVDISPNNVIKEATGATNLEVEWTAGYIHNHPLISFFKTFT